MTSSVEDDFALVVDEALASVEVTTAAGVAEDTDGNEHGVGHGWKKMNDSRFLGKAGKVQFADVRRLHEIAVGVLDRDGSRCWLLVDDRDVDGREVAGAAGIEKVGGRVGRK